MHTVVVHYVNKTKIVIKVVCVSETTATQSYCHSVIVYFCISAVSISQEVADLTTAKHAVPVIRFNAA